MTKIKRGVQQRNSRGAAVAVIAMSAFFIMLPLGLLAFEVARVYLAQKQLQNAVDAAALTAMTGLGDGSLDDQEVKKLSLDMVRRNSVTSETLKPAHLSNSVDTDNPKAGKSTFNLTIDHSKNQVKASAAFGYTPAFAVLLNLGTFTIRANALAGTKSATGDIVIAVDISDSIKAGCGVNNQPDGGSSKSWIVTRHTNLKGVTPKYTYTSVTKAGVPKGAPPVTIPVKPRQSYSPAGLHVGGNFLHAIPDPAQVDWAHSSNKVYNQFANKTTEEKVALLAESKQGHLNDLGNKAKFDPLNKIDKHHLGDTALAKYLPGIGDGSIPAGNDYRAAYEEVGLPFVHPLADEKRDIKTLVEAIVKNNPDANIALVGFAPRAGGHFTAPHVKKGQPTPPVNFPPEAGVFGLNYGYGESCINGTATEPFVRFTKDHDEIIKSASVCTTFLGTNTTDALKVSHALLTENQRNLKGVPQACFLLTDGVPTVGGYVKAAKKFGQDGIPIKVIGYVHTGYASHGGKVCTKIANQGGPGSKYIPAPYINLNKHGFVGRYDANNQDVLLNAFNGAPVLIND